MRITPVLASALILCAATCSLTAATRRAPPTSSAPAAAPRAVKDAMERLRLSDPEDRIEALHALRAQAAEATSAIPMLIGLLGDYGEAGSIERPERVTDAAVNVLVAIGRPAVGPLATALGTGSPLEKPRAAAALALMGGAHVK